MNKEVLIRLISFFSIFVIVALCEFASPKRRLTVSKSGRWINNLGVILLDTLMVRLLMPATAVSVAMSAQRDGWGLINSFQVPTLPAVVIGLLALDCIIYLQHLMFHAVPLLWRLHMVHHADLDIDVSTGLRYAPCAAAVRLLRWLRSDRRS